MEPKDHIEKFGHYKRASLQFDLHQQTDDESSIASPRSANVLQSPTSDFSQSVLISRGRDGLDFEGEMRKSLIGPQRVTTKYNSKSEKEKRKRSRVTPEQRVQLEQYFATDRSPAAARRKEISDTLGMQERQTQIWFQNRRAKAKVHDGILPSSHRHSRRDSPEIVSDAPPELSAGFEADLHNLIHEEDPVTIIPCTDLTVGSWRRIATSTTKHDLVAYVSEVKRCFTWFIHSGGYGFKMEIPFHAIVNTEFSQISPGTGQAVFILSHPPIFYLENISSPRANGSVERTWKRCSDWTEGHQATNVLLHTLIGSADQLAHVLQSLHPNPPASHPVVVLPPSYQPEPETSQPIKVELPPPPLAGLGGVAYPYMGSRIKNQITHIDTSASHRRPSYGTELRYPSGSGQRPPPHSAPSGNFPLLYIHPDSQPPATAPVTGFESNLTPHTYRTIQHQGSTSPDYLNTTHLYQQHLSNQSTVYHRSNSPPSLQAFQSENHILPDAPDQLLSYLPSSSILTSPYVPQPSRGTPNHPDLPSANAMAGIVYEVDVDLRHQQSQ